MNCLIYSIQLVFLAVSVNAWHRSVKFNFTLSDISTSQVNVFESGYMGNDYFSMVSSNRNNHLDTASNSIYIGGRNHLYQLSLPDLEQQSVSVNQVQSDLDNPDVGEWEKLCPE